MHNDLKKVLITHENIVLESKKISEIISNDYKNEPLVLIGILKGCIPFFAELIKNINIPIEMDFMAVSSYQNTSSTGVVKYLKDITIDIKDKNILIVEDIVDTGLTLQSLIEHLKKYNPKSIEIVTLLNKKCARKVDIDPKYSLFDIPNEFVIGFGLDYNEFYRNLPYVGVLDEKIYKKNC